MLYQNVINLFNWIEIYDDARGTYNRNSQIKFQSTTLKSNLCDFIDPYIFVEETISTVGVESYQVAWLVVRNNKQVLIQNCAPFTGCISGRNYTHVD